MDCEFCNSKIPNYRIKNIKRKGGRLKYCSEKCNKRAYYKRHFKGESSALFDGPGFNSETQKGLYWEIYMSKILGAECLSTEIMNQESDLILGDKKIDVKSSNIYYRKTKNGSPVKRVQKGWWVFNRNKLKEIDLFACVCLKDNKPVKAYLIPSDEFPKKGAVIGHKSKYDKYIINLDNTNMCDLERT